MRAELIHDVASLDEQLASIFQVYNGLEVLDYQLHDSLYAHLLRRPDLTIVFLRRRNMLRALVSAFIAGQTGIWHKEDLDRSLADYYAKLQPLPLAQAERYLAIGKQDMNFFEDVVSSRPDGTYLKLTYEDLYVGSAHQREACMARIWEFLGLEPVAPSLLQRYLDPAQARINSDESYRWLPNAQEINDQLGCDETGWLFER